MNIPGPEASPEDGPLARARAADPHAPPADADEGSEVLKKLLGLVGMGLGGALVVAPLSFAFLAIFVIKDPPNSQGRTGGIILLVLICIPLVLLGRLLWKAGRSPFRSAARRAELGAFLRDKEEFTVAQVALFCGVSDARAQRLVERLIARGELHVVFVPERGAYAIPSRASKWTFPEWMPAIPRQAPASPAPPDGGPVAIRRLLHRCPSCNAPHELTGARVGDRVRCPYCDNAFQVVAARED
ncbi:MarR family transcriptional regulator [Myxococcus stipitatus]|uniref:MarR family transcriptional regulator n=1 Tax=Myxococcus stipitatus TaxID=83455 RepID=UPI003145614F